MRGHRHSARIADRLALGVGLCCVGMLALLPTDRPQAQSILLSHGVTVGDRAAMLRSFRQPPLDWTRPDFDDTQWQRYVVSASPQVMKDPSGAVVMIPSLWTPGDAGLGAQGPLAGDSAGQGAAAAMSTDEPTLPSSEPDVPLRDGLIDAGLLSSPPVAAVELAGAALRAGLAATMPGALLLASPVQAKRSGRSARELSEPLLPDCGGSLFIRRKFDFSGIPGGSGSAGTLLLRVRYSDGVVAHINGTEVLRSRLPEPPPGDLPLFASDRGPSDPERYYLPVSSLPLRGHGNVLAIEVHPRTPLRCPQVEAELLALTGPRLLRGPYIERLTETTLDVTVETELPSRVLIRYGKGEKVQHRDREVESSGEPQTVHRLHVGPLKPGTLHHYQVVLLGDGQKRSDLPLQTFHTPPVAGMPLKIVAYGDSRSGHPVHAQVISSILAEDPDLVLHTGDLVERGTEEGDWDRFFSLTAPLLARTAVYISPGNHDYAIRKQGSLRLYSLFQTMFPPQLPTPSGSVFSASRVLADTVAAPAPLGNLSEAARGYYSVDVSGVHLVSIDSNQAGKADQHRWLEADLTRADQQVPKPRAIIAWMHEGPFSSGWHGDYPTAIKHLVPILQKHGTTLLISGHDHDYERGQRQGLDYIVTGGGGAELRPLKCDPRRRRCKNQPLYFANEHHYLRLEVLPTVLRVCPRRPDGTALEECQVLRLRRP